jgi:hypothetical protein
MLLAPHCHVHDVREGRRDGVREGRPRRRSQVWGDRIRERLG